MKFEQDDSPLGDLAYDVKKDQQFPKRCKDAEKLGNYFRSKTRDPVVLKIADKVLASYKEIKDIL
ncbi:sterile alpha motif-like domain-containing protein [Staphylococcus aureus]|nr:sterile alpha motif-like domain-containing protein [Staphylococcus aureus]